MAPRTMAAIASRVSAACHRSARSVIVPLLDPERPHDLGGECRVRVVVPVLADEDRATVAFESLLRVQIVPGPVDNLAGPICRLAADEGVYRADRVRPARGAREHLGPYLGFFA